MTPYHHWLRNYKKCQVEIKLADGSSIYSEGIGTVLFELIINGSPAQQLKFSNVLHVPALRNNLFSALFLSLHKNFSIHIHKNTISFELGSKTLFIAKIDSPSTAAYLYGTAIPIPESANLSSSTTLPMDLEHWHHVTFGFQRNPDIARKWRRGVRAGLAVVMDYQQLQEAGLKYK